MNHNFFNLSARKKRDLLYELVVGKLSEGNISKKELNAVKRIVEGFSSTKAPIKIKKQPGNP